MNTEKEKLPNKEVQEFIVEPGLGQKPSYEAALRPYLITVIITIVSAIIVVALTTGKSNSIDLDDDEIRSSQRESSKEIGELNEKLEEISLEIKNDKKRGGGMIIPNLQDNSEDSFIGDYEGIIKDIVNARDYIIQGDYLKSKNRFHLYRLKSHYAIVGLPQKVNRGLLRTISDLEKIISQSYKPELIPSSKVESTGGETVHYLKKGETLNTLSKKYNISVERLMKLNSLDSSEFKSLSIGKAIVVQK